MSSSTPSTAVQEVIGGLYRSQEENMLLNVVDNLRTQKLGQLISIPQLIIIGDQSSGKSTTLETGTSMPFPTADGLCTVFATELRLRRADEFEISIRIIPAPHSSDTEKQKIEEFGGKRDSITREDIGEWINKAKKVMGISDSNPISDDILQINVSGPTYPMLTIVDLPGLTHAGRGKESIQAMVNAYMAEPRSVILAVISGKNDIENQKVLDLVKLYDPNGARTLGIITKPDIPKEGTKSERDLIALAKNEHPEFRFRLGWHCLRGRSEKEVGTSEEVRDEVERKFFATGSWKSVPRSYVGKETLKPRLNKVLMNQIRAEFPALVTEVEGKFQEHKSMLEKLGDSRTTLEEQRTFLIGLSTKFRQLVNDAIGGSYNNSFFGNPLTEQGYNRRLRAVIQNLNIDFSENMRLRGHAREILETDEVPDAYDEDADDAGHVGHTEEAEHEPLKILRADFCEEVANSLKRSRGCELPGMFNPLFIRDLFIHQAAPWKDLATNHIQAALASVTCFLNDAVAELTRIPKDGPKKSVAANDVEEAILREIISPFITNRAKEMEAKLENVLQVYYTRNPITYNHYFTDTVQNMRKKRLQDRVMEELSKYLGRDEANMKRNSASLTINPIKFIEGFSTDNEADMDKFACAEIVDYMESYYKIALKRMIDNVADQIIEEQLIDDLPNLFSPLSIQKMPAYLISKIAAESVADQCKRQELKRVLAILEKSLETCKAFQVGASMNTVQPSTTEWGAQLSDSSTPGTPLTPASLTESATEIERSDTMSQSSESIYNPLTYKEELFPKHIQAGDRNHVPGEFPFVSPWAVGAELDEIYD